MLNQQNLLRFICFCVTGSSRKPLANESWRCLGRQKDISLKTSSIGLQDVYNTFSPRQTFARNLHFHEYCQTFYELLSLHVLLLFQHFVTECYWKLYLISFAEFAQGIFESMVDVLIQSCKRFWKSCFILEQFFKTSVVIVRSN